jgi:hypothetical protein
MCIKYVNPSRVTSYHNWKNVCAQLVLFTFNSHNICNAIIILKLEMKIFVFLNCSVDMTNHELTQWP